MCCSLWYFLLYFCSVQLQIWFYKPNWEQKQNRQFLCTDNLEQMWKTWGKYGSCFQGVLSSFKVSLNTFFNIMIKTEHAAHTWLTACPSQSQRLTATTVSWVLKSICALSIARIKTYLLWKQYGQCIKKDTFILRILKRKSWNSISCISKMKHLIFSSFVLCWIIWRATEITVTVTV